MIVHDFNVARADGTLRPLETDAPLIVDANAVLATAGRANGPNGGGAPPGYRALQKIFSTVIGRSRTRLPVA